MLDVLLGHREPHELPNDLHDLWRDGFRAGQEHADARVTRANADADAWYYRANNGPEIRAEHDRMLREFSAVLNRRATRDKWAELDRLAAERAAAVREVNA